MTLTRTTHPPGLIVENDSLQKCVIEGLYEVGRQAGDMTMKIVGEYSRKKTRR